MQSTARGQPPPAPSRAVAVAVSEGLRLVRGPRHFRYRCCTVAHTPLSTPWQNYTVNRQAGSSVATSCTQSQAAAYRYHPQGKGGGAAGHLRMHLSSGRWYSCAAASRHLVGAQRMYFPTPPPPPAQSAVSTPPRQPLLSWPLGLSPAGGSEGDGHDLGGVSRLLRLRAGSPWRRASADEVLSPASLPSHADMSFSCCCCS